MGLFDKIKKAAGVATTQEEPEPEAISVVQEPNTILVPTAGEVMPIDQVPDPFFAGLAMGNGLGVKPTEEVVYAPVSGMLATIGAPNYHALMLASDDGAEILIHVGVDTVEMKGDGFKVYGTKGDRVKAGTPLLGFSRQAIKNAGYDDTVIMCVTNTSDYESVELACEGTVSAGEVGLKLA
jgi:glucose-specific phosphotransferase system IIA component